AVVPGSTSDEKIKIELAPTAVVVPASTSENAIQTSKLASTVEAPAAARSAPKIETAREPQGEAPFTPPPPPPPDHPAPPPRPACGGSRDRAVAAGGVFRRAGPRFCDDRGAALFPPVARSASGRVQCPACGAVRGSAAASACCRADGGHHDIRRCARRGGV